MTNVKKVGLYKNLTFGFGHIVLWDVGAGTLVGDGKQAQRGPVRRVRDFLSSNDPVDAGNEENRLIVPWPQAGSRP